MNRLAGLLRDAWWLVAIAFVFAIVYAVAIDPFVGAAIPLVTIPTLLYFAYIRYDASGKRIEKSERSDRD